MVGTELFKYEDARRQGLWCDGLVPEAYDLDSPLPCIRGRAWINGRPGMDTAWQFTLLVGRGVRSRAEIDWEALSPDAETTTGWLTYNVQWKTVVIDPAVAVPWERPSRRRRRARANVEHPTDERETRPGGT